MHRSDLFALVVGMGVGMGGGVLGALLALRARSMELPHVVRQYGGPHWEPPVPTANTSRETPTLSPWLVARDRKSRLYLIHP